MAVAIDLKNMKPRERTMAVLLVSAMVFGMAMKFIHGPLTAEIRKNSAQLKKYDTRLKDLSRDYPQLEKYRSRIESLQGVVDQLSKKAREASKDLPSKTDTSQLMGEFTRMASSVELLSARQKIQDEEGFSSVSIEAKFNGSFPETVRYIRRLESMSPFLKVDELDIREPKKGSGDAKTPARLVMSSILGDEPMQAPLAPAKDEKEAAGPKRDIFASKSRPAADSAKKINLKLEGITFNGENSTAIINGDVMRLNAKVGTYTVKKILQNGVMLTDGAEDMFLEMER